MNGTQIVDAFVAAPAVAWGWFWGLNLGLKSGVVCALVGIYQVITHVMGSLRKRETEAPSHNVEVNVNVPERIDSQTLAEQVYEDQRKDLKEAHQTIQSKDAEIKALRDVIDGLRKPQETPKEDNFAAQAEAELAKGNPHLAKVFYKEEAEKNVEAGDDRYLKAAQAYRRLGFLDFMSNPKEAAKAYRKSLELDPNSADAWNRLGLLYQLFGDMKEAEEAYGKVLQLKKNDNKWKSIAYGNLGLIRYKQGDLEGAEEFYNKALEIDIEIGSKEGMAVDYGNLGVIRKIQGDLEGAEEFHNKALKLHDQLGSKEGMAADYGNLGIIRKTQGDLEGAEEFYNEALEIDIEIGRKEGMAIRYANLGLIREDQGKLQEAREFWEKSLDLYTQMGAAPMIERIQGWLDGLDSNEDS
jgi:tetratricopeptide (TPR) repeat protein